LDIDLKNFLLYRALQVLNNKFNECYSPLTLTICPFAIFMMEVICGVATIKLYRYLPLSVFLIFPIVKTAILLTMTLLIRMAGNVYDSSRRLLSKWKANIDHQQSQQRIQFSTSCTPVMVKVGSFTYISMYSIGFYFSFVIDSTISALVAIEFD